MTTTLFAKILAAVVFGTVGAAFMLFHPAGPGLVLAAVTPFDGLFLVFGNVGNLITFVPVVALLVRNSPAVWVRIFAGTQIQVMFIVLLAVLSISHLIAINQIGMMALIQFARKLTVLLVLGVFAWSMRNGKHLELMNRVVVVSFAVFAVMSLLDFYLGIRSLPGAADTYGGAIGLSAEEAVIHELRFHGGGISINATGNWLLTPAFVALGWFTSPQARGKVVAFTCLIIIAGSIFATMSRSAILGFGVGGLLVLPYISRLRPAQVFFTALGGVITVGIVVLVLEQAGFLDALIARFFPELAARDDGPELTRTMVFGAALRIWATSPFLGVGDGTTALNPNGIGFGAHNAFLGVLAEAGVLGIIPFVLMVGMIVYRLARPLAATDDSVYRHWRPFFLAGYVASMTMSMFNEYPWERMTWYAVAFAVALDAGAARVRSRSDEDASPQATIPDDHFFYGSGANGSGSLAAPEPLASTGPPHPRERDESD